MKFWMVILLPAWGLAQVTFEVAPRTLGVNQNLSWTITIENPQRDLSIRLPDGVKGGDFQLLSNTAKTTSSVSIANGQVSQVQSMVYEFRPSRSGKLIFPRQVVLYGGKEFISPETEIEVGPPVKTQPGAGRGRRDPFDTMFDDPFGDVFGRRQPDGTPRVRGEVFVRAEVSKSDYYVGELIPFRVKLYRRAVRVESMGSNMDLPSFHGFWTEELERPPPPTTRERIDDKVYEVNIVHERNLFASRPGEIVIEPTRFSLNVSASGFFSNWQRVQRETEPLELNIKALPENDMPANFTGAVGRFQLLAEVDPPKTKVGDTTSLRIQVSGLGNFSAIQNFELPDLSGDFEIFEGGPPQVTKTQGVITGKTWVFALVPNAPGELEIPSISLTYFDPETQRYHSLKQGPFDLLVSPGEGLPEDGSQSDGVAEFKIDKTLRYIKLDDSGTLNQRRVLPHASLLVHLIAAVVAVNAIVMIVLLFYRRRLGQRDALRPRMAWRNFKKQMAKLRRKRKDLEADTFFSRLSEIVMEYFGDKWQRPAPGISLDAVEEEFSAQNLDRRHHRELVELIESCDLARFTPNHLDTRERLLDQARRIIADIEEALP